MISSGRDKAGVMRERVYSKREWEEVLKGLAKTTMVYVPVKEGDIHAFRVLEEGKKPDFAYQNTRLSPKGIVYPPSERMFEVSLDEKDPDANIYREAVKEVPPQILVGIRPCDAQGFQIVKRNFDNPEYRDPWWVRRFESTTLVGLGCNEPCATCFCSSVGGGPFSDIGLDALLRDMGDRYVVKAITRKGETFLNEAGGGCPGEIGPRQNGCQDLHGPFGGEEHQRTLSSPLLGRGGLWVHQLRDLHLSLPHVLVL
jgi:sulfhydrogenase subunit beta (sulfur reductase)